MSVRTYNPSVRVGNWNEDIQLEEDTLKDFLERREKGQLLIQRTANLKDSILHEVQLSVSRTGKVHFGDKVMLVNLEPKDCSRSTCSLSLNVSDSDIHGGGASTSCSLSGSTNVKPCERTGFTITSMDGTPKGEPLQYNQPFYICLGDWFLASDRANFSKSARKSRHNEVSLVKEPSHLCEWKVLPFDPTYRMELEWSPVPANEKVIITHRKTNENLCVEKDFLLRTPFGKEFEISTHTVLDSHKAETDVNHWMLQMNVPGDTTRPMEPPQPEPVQTSDSQQ